jgi:hypothetical protein
MKIYRFPDPSDALCKFQPDSLPQPILGVPDVHPVNGAPCQSFLIPESVPNQQGAHLTIEKAGYVPYVLHGILSTQLPYGYFDVDVFRLQPEKVCPDPIPVPPIPPPTDKTPLGIIKSVYARGIYNLSTKEGCGQFTEACCKELHEQLSETYGHLRKAGAQNQYNGHAVDALQRLAPQLDAGIYDIIISSESPDAEPAYNRAGDADPTKWYYPA